MAWAGGPRRVDECVMKVLLHVLDDLVACLAWLEILEGDGSKTTDFGIVFGTDGCQDIAPK